MHIILGLLGVIVTILILLNRLQENGIDIGWLNPFAWKRRRKFRKEYQANPAYTLTSPMDVTALFMVAVAKVDGDMSKEQKERILSLFQSEFRQSSSQATSLLGSSVHLFARGDEVLSQPKAVLARSLDKFSEEQIKSVNYLLHEVAKSENGQASQAQLSLIEKIMKEFPVKNNNSW